ncbi:MAG TPA: division/cell wall cluster transcriptional repressor MraZ [Stellaceae bacterium]|nr:division/cell wall cluster transcriptional repressor MraZ [Stellaceae bacterium]
MALFSSTYFNKIDRKGRVSVPAGFRAALAGQSFAGIVAFRSLKFPALDAGGYDRLEEIAKGLDELPEFSDEHDALASILSDACDLPFDSEGRIVLPQHLIEHAALTEQVAFVGIGRSFQLWEPTRYQRHQDEMRERVRQRGFTLPPRSPAR